MNEDPTTPERDEATGATPDATTNPNPGDEGPAGGWSADQGPTPSPVGRFDLAAVFTAVTDAVVGIARDVSNAAGPALHDAAVKAGPGVRETAARAADVAAKAADAAGPIAGKVAGATGDAGHRLADRSRTLASDLRSMSPIPPTGAVSGTADEPAAEAGPSEGVERAGTQADPGAGAAGPEEAGPSA